MIQTGLSFSGFENLTPTKKICYLGQFIKYNPKKIIDLADPKPDGKIQFGSRL